MLNLLFTDPLVFIVTALALIISITIHEFSHAFIADKLGDPTPRIQGRLTLNPLAHLDPLGTLALLFTRFGWGKPVQFDPYNLKNPVKDGALIAIAGPISNLILASVLAILFRSQLVPFDWLNYAIAQTILINVVLAIFNLVPVHPLDGGKIILALLPRATAIEYEELMNRYGLFLLLALIFPWFQGQSPISYLISPIINGVSRLLLQ